MEWALSEVTAMLGHQHILLNSN